MALGGGSMAQRNKGMAPLHAKKNQGYSKQCESVHLAAQGRGNFRCGKQK